MNVSEVCVDYLWTWSWADQLTDDYVMFCAGFGLDVLEAVDDMFSVAHTIDEAAHAACVGALRSEADG